MQFDIRTISNIQTVFAPMPDANSTTIQILVKAGSVYETRETNGLSHFLEHLFFKGGKKYPTPKSVAETIDAFGGECNAFTGNEYAGYYVKCAPDYIDQAIDVLSDMLVDPQFPVDELEREKGVVIQEIMMYEDNPQRNVWNKRNERYYGDNSYGRSTLGPIENVQSFTQDDLHRHKQDLYTKDNLIIIVAGAIPDQQHLEELIDTLFDRLPDHKRIQTPIYTPHEPSTHESSYTKGTQQNHLIISAPGFSMHQDERHAAKILSKILGGGMSSRLFQNIREKQGLCYYIRAMHDDNDADGNFLIKAGIEKARRDAGLAAIYNEIEDIASGHITQDEFDNALGNITGTTKMGIESSDQLASFVGYQLLFKQRIRTLDEILADYQSLTLDDVRQLCNRLSREHLWAYRVE